VPDGIVDHNFWPKRQASKPRCCAAVNVDNGYDFLVFTTCVWPEEGLCMGTRKYSHWIAAVLHTSNEFKKGRREGRGNGNAEEESSTYSR